jgi:class 3 adenylate cyclase
MANITGRETMSFENEDFFNFPQYLSEKFLETYEYVDTKDESSIETDSLENGYYTVTFCPETENYCLGMVDMVNSTQISATLGSKKMSLYYQIFLNSMSKILNKFDGKVVKNIGDCLLYYFPVHKIKNPEDYLIESLECSFAMIESHDFICQYLKKVPLPCLDYRISMDYGNVTLMKSSDSASIDMIGIPVNMCAKINRKAPTNGIVVGGDIREMLKKVHRYEFEEIGGYSVGLKLDYPIYVARRNGGYF